MKEFLCLLRKGDVLIVLGLFILSFIPGWLFYQSHQPTENQILVAEVSVDGQTVHSFSLDNNEVEEWNYDDGHGHVNQLIKEGNKVKIITASCPDQLCVRQGEISYTGETLVCLPHRLVVEVVGRSDEVPLVDIIG